MRKLVLGAIVGLVIGVVSGSTLIAPSLDLAKKPRKAKSPHLNLEDTRKKTEFTHAKPLPVEKKPIRWRMASAYDSTLPQLGELGVQIEEAVLRLSGGFLHLKLHEPETLVPNQQIFNAVRSKAIKAAFGTPRFWADKNPAFLLYSSIPFGPPLHEYLSWLFDGGGVSILTELYEQEGLQGFVCGAIAPKASGWFQKPVDKVKTFQTLRIGMGGLGAMVVGQLGAKTLELDANQILLALKDNTIDGAEASQPAVDINRGFHKIAKHYYFPGWHQPATLLHLIINADSWRDLPKITQIQIKTACANNTLSGVALGHARQFTALKALTRSGVQIHTWRPEIIAALKSSWGHVRNELARTSPEFNLAWSSIKRFREKYAIWHEISGGSHQTNRY